MGRVVLKFGGSSVADADSIKRVARRVAATQREGNEVAVLISAMGDTTDELLDLAHQVSPNPPARELDMLLTTGERQSAALLAMAINDLGSQARSYTGSQAGDSSNESGADYHIMPSAEQWTGRTFCLLSVERRKLYNARFKRNRSKRFA